MIAIGNGEKCPYCINEMERPNEDVFVNQPDNDFMKHCMEEHKDFLFNDLFGDNKDKVVNEGREETGKICIGVEDKVKTPSYKHHCYICGEGTDIGYYNYYAGDTEENILCEKGDCWSEWNSDQMQEVTDE